jgi:pyruvate,water dikinase
VGLKGLKSVAPNRELRDIAGDTSGLEESQVAIIASGNASEIREALGSSEDGGRVLARVEDFLERFRFLSANGTNFGEPTWAEEPGPVWISLGRMIRDGPHNAPDPTTLREQARREVLACLGPVGRRRFKKRLASVGRFLELREGTSLLMTEDTYELRRLFLAMGNHMVEAGRIQDPEDVFFLFFEELIRAFEGAEDPVGLKALIRDRRAEIARDRELDLPETILGEEIPEEVPISEPGALLTGIGVSAGVVRGTARVVRELADAPTLLTREDVLIVPFSDVGWTPLFATVGGIVAEHGGQLSHTAIVAREYGLPAVVAVRGAIREIRDGQTVTVDGGKGQVHLGERPSAGTP